MTRMRVPMAAVGAIAVITFASPAFAVSVKPTAEEVAGRKAFIQLKCTACHRVLGDAGLPVPVASEPAPILGGLNAVHTSDELLLAIRKPSHSIAVGFHPTPSDGSRMGDMKDTMTTQQLWDITAYLRGQEASDAGWKKEGP